MNKQEILFKWEEFSKTVSADFISPGYEANYSVEQFISSSIDSLLNGVIESLPKKRPLPPYTDLNQTYEQNTGYNYCLKEVVNMLNSFK